MGFGGGGSGSFVLPNHTHTNALADGGALPSATTLIDALTIQAYSDAEYTANHVKPVVQQFHLGTIFSTSSATLVDITGMTLTLPTVTDGKAFICCTFTVSNSVTLTNSVVALLDDGVVVSQNQDYTFAAAYPYSDSVLWTMDLDGSVLKCQTLAGAGTTSIQASSGYYSTGITVLQVA